MKSQWLQLNFIKDVVYGTIRVLPECFINKHLLHKPVAVLDDFIGIAVAASENQESFDYIFDALNELAVNYVRIDVSYAPINQANECLIEELAKRNYKICLHLVIPRHQAIHFEKNKNNQEEWRKFLKHIFQKFAKVIEYVEVGSTINRYAWTHLSPEGLFVSWKIAYEEAKAYQIKIIGPNVTDFEPFYNIGVLKRLYDLNLLPAVHTDNLFVERATEPENFDHKIAGRAVAPFLKFNMVSKARLLNRIGEAFNVKKTLCSHFSWSLRRIGRLLEDREAKQADYIARYYLLAAASGALSRVYFGPLIGQRDGLIDDGTTFYPEIPTVTFYGTVYGAPENYRKRKAFYVFKTLNQLLPQLNFVRAISQNNGLFILEFLNNTKNAFIKELFPSFYNESYILHALWTTNAKRVLLNEIYDTVSLNKAYAISIDGKAINIPSTVSETPLYLLWHKETPPTILYQTNRNSLKPFIFTSIGDYSFINYEGKTKEGKNVVVKGILSKEKFLQNKQTISFDDVMNLVDKEQSSKLLRKSRNCVWQVEFAIHNINYQFVVKKFGKENFVRRLLNSRKQDRATRSWNGASELIRRGLPSPNPVAVLKVYEEKGKKLLNCYYICEALATSLSCRDAFNAYSKGEIFNHITEDVFFDKTTDFLIKIHTRGVFFRDLSAGNLMIKIKETPNIEFFLIDTTRARFFNQPVSAFNRLCDLMRLLHPLYWKGRKLFLNYYAKKAGWQLNYLFYLPFIYYDLKHTIKRWLKPLRRNKR